MLASIVNTTNVEGILQLDCNATDFFGNRDFPTYLVYNPHDGEKIVTIQIPEDNSDLFDLVSKKIIARNVSGKTDITLPAGLAKTIVAIPSQTKTEVKNNRLVTSEGEVIDYRYEHSRGNDAK